jgi:hypothetical protein
MLPGLFAFASSERPADLSGRLAVRRTTAIALLQKFRRLLAIPIALAAGLWACTMRRTAGMRFAM